MHPRIKRWIFVTGAPRSATTFVGRILSGAPQVDYIHEPFNPDCGIAGVERPFLYLEQGEPRELALRPQIERLLDYRAPLKTGYYRNDTPLRRLAKRVVGSRGPFHLRLARLNPLHHSAVIKDPIGCLLTEYLLLRYAVRPIVVLRHPLGFVASTLRLNWDLDLAPLLEQPRLVQRFFEPADLELARRHQQGTPLQRAAVLWRLLNRALLAMAHEHAEILLVRHEDLCLHPLENFERIFDHAGLPLRQSTRRSILRHTGGERAQARRGRVQDFRRDSRAIGRQQGELLSPAQAAEVLAICMPVAAQHYPAAALCA
jgi:hypothetical protein